MSRFDGNLPGRKLDDEEIIRQFAAQQAHLISNQNLRIEAKFDTTQLLSRKEGILAVLKHGEQTVRAVSRHESRYWPIVHKALIEGQFIPLSPNPEKGWIHYQYFAVPNGYHINYTEARLLWKEWWVQRYHHNQSALQLDLLVYLKDNWYPIRDIISSRGVLFIRSLAGEIMVEGAASMVWLSRTSHHRKSILNMAAGSAKPPGAYYGVSEDIDSSSDALSPESHTSESYFAPLRAEETVDQSDPLTFQQEEDDDYPMAPLPSRESRSQQNLKPLPKRRSLDFLTAPSNPPAPDNSPPPAPPYTNGNTQAYSQPPEALSVEMMAEINKVLRVEQGGRIYIRTEVGEIAIQGTDLRFWLTKFKQ